MRPNLFGVIIVMNIVNLNETYHNIVTLNKRCHRVGIHPSTSLHYAQDQRFARPFGLSVPRRGKSKHERHRNKWFRKPIFVSCLSEYGTHSFLLNLRRLKRKRCFFSKICGLIIRTLTGTCVHNPAILFVHAKRNREMTAKHDRRLEQII